MNDGPLPQLQFRPVQTRRSSLLEVVLNYAVGFWLAIFTQALVYPWFGIQTSWQTDIRLASIFTVVSMLRSYVLRRCFELWHRR